MDMVGRRIASARIEAGLIQRELAELIGVHESSIRKYERGTTQPRPHRIRAIAQATNKPLSHFVDDASSDAPGDVQEVLKQIQWAIPVLLAAQGIDVQRGEEYAGIRELLADEELTKSLEVTDDERLLLLAGYTGPVGPANKHEAVKLLQTLRDMTSHRGVQVDRDDRVA